jgi:hypothetical protein
MNALTAKGIGLALGLALATSGCFTVEHRLPAHSYFGRMSARPDETARDFDQTAMKNWFLAGLFPYSDFTSGSLVSTGSPVRRIEVSELETQFNTIDNIAWVIPGQFYGYYVWAPRHVRIRGREIRAR